MSTSLCLHKEMLPFRKLIHGRMASFESDPSSHDAISTVHSMFVESIVGCASYMGTDLRSLTPTQFTAWVVSDAESQEITNDQPDSCGYVLKIMCWFYVRGARS